MGLCMFSVTFLKHLDELKKDKRYVTFIKDYFSTFLVGEMLVNLDDNENNGSNPLGRISGAMNNLLASIHLYGDEANGLKLAELGVVERYNTKGISLLRSTDKEAITKLRDRLSAEYIYDNYSALSVYGSNQSFDVDLKAMFLDRALFRGLNAFDIEDVSELSRDDLALLIRWNFLSFKILNELTERWV